MCQPIGDLKRQEDGFLFVLWKHRNSGRDVLCGYEIAFLFIYQIPSGWDLLTERCWHIPLNKISTLLRSVPCTPLLFFFFFWTVWFLRSFLFFFLANYCKRWWQYGRLIAATDTWDWNNWLRRHLYLALTFFFFLIHKPHLQKTILTYQEWNKQIKNQHHFCFTKHMFRRVGQNIRILISIWNWPKIEDIEPNPR